MTEPMPSAGVAKGNLMAGKRGLIMGLANNRSIAWGIARAAAAQGAELAFTYQGDALKKRVEPLAAELGSKVVLPCDVVDAASMDAVFAEPLHDERRIEFIRDHLAALHAAIEQGVNVVGYCHWSLLDNFEWALGYAQRFGLVHVDYGTQARTVKDSGRYYGRIARANELLELETRR